MLIRGTIENVRIATCWCVESVKNSKHASQHMRNLAFESTVVPKCMRSLLFFTLAFNDSY